MNVKIWAITSGVYNLGLVIFHLTFWKLFHWKEDLFSLSFINRAVMQILNLSLIVIFIIFAYISVFYSTELFTTSLGHTLLLLISIFWFLRASQQIWFFGWKNKISFLFFMAFMAGCILYLIPFIKTVRFGS